MNLVSVLIRTSLRAYGYVVNEKKLLIVSNEYVPNKTMVSITRCKKRMNI
jgi:hypothetical protein